MTPMMQPREIVPGPGGTLTYDQSAQLMSDATFRGRVKTACLSYATQINEEPSTTPTHNARLRWAVTCYQNPDIVSQGIVNPTVLDPAVQTAGSAIGDLALQGAVQAVIDKIM
jgi:hypothetical protein